MYYLQGGTPLLVSMPSHEELKNTFTYSGETGLLYWKKRNSNRIKIGDAAGSLSNLGTIQLRINGRLFSAHRVIWAIVHGYEPPADLVIDHIDGVRSNNRISNLRLVTQAENTRNTRIGRRNKSGVLGVSFKKSKRRWIAIISDHGKSIYLGSFIKKEGAIKARRYAQRWLGYHPLHGTVKSDTRSLTGA
ncbi:HNH endonuclease [Gammaproteobacteria bacterium LSUCC0112]|nr:HNH endonuclease [Gammaproteobacteria bacterium LSUCC0112]